MSDLLRDDAGTAVLLGSSCGGCGRPSFPRSDVCCWCGRPDPDPVELSTTGTLWGWAVVHSAPPGYAGPVPYGMGVVELPEGLRVVSRIDVADEAALTQGRPVRLVVVELPTGDPEDPVLRTWEAAPC